MAEPQPVTHVGRRQFALWWWWQSWVGRFALHLPLVICAFAYLKFILSAQGQTALEFPVERPLVGVFIVYALIGVCVEVQRCLWLAYRATSIRPPVITLRPKHVEPQLSVGEEREVAPPSIWLGLVNFLVLVLAITGGVLTVAERSGTEANFFPYVALVLGVLVGVVFIKLIEVVLTRFKRKRLEVSLSGSVYRFISDAYPICLAVAIYAGGICLVINHLDALAGLGAHVLVASGLLAMTLLCQGLLFLLLVRASLRAGWLVLAVVILLYLVQAPLAERPNPLLTRTPTVEYAQSTCAQLATKTQTTTDPQSKQSPTQAPGPPSILVSAEGGGLRAAYWTAVSLEELSQARVRPLLNDAVILSGVSGGSLGVATFLAAQELPPSARLPCIREFLSGDFLSPFLAGLLFLDVPRLVLPTWILDTHRGDYFEAFVARRWLVLTKSDYFYRLLARAAGDGQRHTAVYFNSTDALSGEYIALVARPTDNASAAEQPSLSPLNEAILNRMPDLRIAQAVHMSARFPYVSANPDLRMSATEASPVLFKQTASTLNAKGTVSIASLVDGGYFDNSGLWPGLRLLERDRDRDSRSDRFFIHIVNDQLRGCNETPCNTGCIHVQSRLISELRSSRGGWLSRPLEALLAVRSEHSLQNITALKLAQAQSKAQSPLVWQVPMKDEEVTSIDWFLDLVQWLPIHGRDLRHSGVALAWTLAPLEREFLSEQAAAIRTTSTPGIRSSDRVERKKECSTSQK